MEGEKYKILKNKKMKRESGLGIIGIILIIVIIAGLIVGAVYLVKQNISKEENDQIRSNMLLIQATCAILKQDSIKSKNTDMYVGTKVADLGEDELINDFKSKNVITEEDYSKYYCLKDENLEALGLDIKNEEGSYYLINYDAGEVIITKGYNGKYKLSEIS